MSSGAPWARLWGHGGPGGFHGPFLDAFWVPRGCRREFFWRHFSVFRGMISPCNFGHVSGRFFMVLCRFWTPSGIVFETFRWFSALAETVAPPARELCFRCFKRSETRFCPASLFKGLSETIFSMFWRILGSAGAPIGPALGTSGRLFSEGIFDVFWVPR